MNGWIVLFAVALLGAVQCALRLDAAVAEHRFESMIERCRPGFLVAPIARRRRWAIAMWIAAVVVEVAIAAGAAWRALT